MDVGSVIGKIPTAIASGFAGMMASKLADLIRIDHPMTMNFAVEIDGVWDAGFVAAEGLHDRSSGYTIKECNQQTSKSIFPHKRKIGDVTLEKGVTFGGVMEDWYYEFSSFQKGDDSPVRDVSVVQLHRLPESVPYLGGMLIEIKRWVIPNAVCHDLTFPKYRALRGKEISILQSMIKSTTPEMVGPPSNFGMVGQLIDALVK